ncbi:MAG TPA: endonuclease V [Candidatus Nanoarchaeia archaeon]|nr:endonuclease V [Candidatus Nanoarchaeia archaeon]
MYQQVNPKELKEIESNIAKGISLKDSFSFVKTVAAFDIAYSEKTYKCVAVVIDIENLKELEVKHIEGEEIMPYSPKLVIFREGPVILESYRSLSIKPDILIVKGNGFMKKSSIGLASYVGVLLNKPVIGVAKELVAGRLDEDKIIANNDVVGFALKAKEFANPVYITPGHNICLDSSVKIIKKVLSPSYKLPLPMHMAHKYVNKIKKEYIQKI